MDPTSTKELSCLLDTVRAHLDKRKRREKVNDVSTAIVFAGGGGKGAYEAGVMLALWDCGIRKFTAISGTSVGALNAALFKHLLQTGERGIVLQVWSDMNMSKVLRWNPWSILKIILYIPVSILAFDKLTSIIESFSIKQYYKPPGLSFLFKNILIKFIAIIPAFIGIFLVYALAIIIGQSSITATLDLNIKFIIFFFLTSFIPICCRWMGKRLGLADNKPLQDTVKSILHPNVLRGDPEIICTLSVASHRLLTTRYPQYPTFEKVTNTNNAVDILIQSAALPEIFPMKNILNNTCVDGGLEDNVPIYGLFPIHPNRLITVYLDDGYRTMLKESRELNIGWIPKDNHVVWDKVSALRIWENTRLADIARRRREKWEGARKEWFDKLELVPIIPSKDLGNLVTGTLNFTELKSRELISLGYKDTLTMLQAWEPRGGSA